MHEKTIYVTRLDSGWKVKINGKVRVVDSIDELTDIFKEWRDQKKYNVHIENVQKIS